jgi:hypothetical protein
LKTYGNSADQFCLPNRDLVDEAFEQTGENPRAFRIWRNWWPSWMHIELSVWHRTPKFARSLSGFEAPNFQTEVYLFNEAVAQVTVLMRLDGKNS